LVVAWPTDAAIKPATGRESAVPGPGAAGGPETLRVKFAAVQVGSTADAPAD
jgi:hypothetical protein